MNDKGTTEKATYREAKRLAAFAREVEILVARGPSPVPAAVVACMTLALVHALGEDDSGNSLPLIAHRMIPSHWMVPLGEACEYFREAVR